MVGEPSGMGEAIGSIECSILTGIPALLDSLLDSASLARPGFDADAYASALRGTACQIDALSRLVGAVATSDQTAEFDTISA
jgi:hypothetical protein